MLNDQQIRIIMEAAKGDSNAEEFLRCFAERCHFVDDLYDYDWKDHAPNPRSHLAQQEAQWLFCLSSNSFWLAHKATLLPLMLASVSAWEDSNAMSEGYTRDVLKGYWHEVVWMVAFIRGGWPHMRSMSGRNRDYDLELPEVLMQPPMNNNPAPL
jgi:hypothetical protein